MNRIPRLGVAGLLLGSVLAFCQASSDALASDVRPDAHVFREYTFRTPKAAPSIVKVDNRGAVWVALARAGKIGRFADGELREYDLPPEAFPVGIAIDPEGQVWFSDIRRNKICRLDPETGALTEHPVPTEHSWPFYLVLGPDGRLYFTERMGNQVGRLDPSTGEIVEFPVPTPNSAPAGMAVTPRGEIYFTENAGNKLGRLDPATGEITELPVPTPLTPSPFYGLAGIASDAAGNLWFAEVDGRLGLLPAGGGPIREIPIPNAAGRPAGVAVDGYGVVWFTELDGNAITSYDPELDEFRSYGIPSGAPDPRPKGPPEATARGELPVPGFTARTSRPFGIAVAPDGRIWFSEQYGHKLGVLEPPPVQVGHPKGVLGDPRVEVRVRLRTDPGTPVRYLLDGEEVPVAGSLDLARLRPGRHEFAVEVGPPGAAAIRSTEIFEMRPGLEKARSLLRSAATPQEISSSLRTTVLEQLSRADAASDAGEGEGFRRALHEAIDSLSEPGREAVDALAETLLDDLRYLDLFGEQRFRIPLASDGRPTSLALRAGDAALFPIGTRPPSAGFIGVAPAEGEEEVHTFYREGEYQYPEVAATGVEVVISARQPRILEHRLPGPGRVPGVMRVDDAGDIWFTAGGGGFLQLAEVPLGNRIGRLSPDGTVVEFETPTLESGPTSLDIAPDGRIWVTERAVNQLAVLDPATGDVVEYPLPTPGSTPTGIAAAPDGRIWYAAKAASRVGVLDPATGEITEIQTPDPDSLPSTIVADAEGAIWFDERAHDRIVRLDPKTWETDVFDVPTPESGVIGLVPHGPHVWFLELRGNKVGRLHVESRQIVEYAIPTRRSAPFKLAVDAAGRVWFTQVFGNRIGVLDGGRFYEYALPREGAMPGGIAIDAEGNVWFSEQGADRIGMIPGAARLPLVGTLERSERAARLYPRESRP